MSANASPRAVRRAAMDAPLAAFPLHEIELVCATAGCAGPRRYLLRDFAGMFGRDVPMRVLLARLRCRHCRQRPAAATLIWMVGQRKPVAVRIPLVGPAAHD